MSNSEIKIEDLLEKIGIEDDNLIIVEDEEDTKKSYVLELKKAFSGDFSDPNQYKFYSSQKVDELLNSLNIRISSFASQKDIDELRQTLTNIVTSNPDGTKDNELIEARGIAPSLSERFNIERSTSDDKYLERIKRNTIFTTEQYTIDGNHKGFVEYKLVQPISEASASRISSRVSTGNTIGIAVSKNFLRNVSYSTSVVNDADNNGFIYTQATNRTIITMSVGMGDTTVDASNVYNTLNTGTYYLYADVSFSENFTDKNVKLVVTYTDSTSDTFDYNHESKFVFYAKKPFSQINIQYNNDNLVEGATASFRNVMVSSRGDVSEYISPVVFPIVTGSLSGYWSTNVEASSNESATDGSYGIVYNNDYVFINTYNDTYSVQLTYYDHSINTETIVNDINDIRNTVEDKTDYCGLITDKGVYQFFNDFSITSYPESMTYETGDETYKRNGEYSIKINIDNTATSNPIIKQAIDETLNNVESATLCFYIDKTVYSNFTDSDGIRVHLSSDDPSVTIANYYTYIIKKSEMVQGWNFVKHPISEFTKFGNPDARKIQSVSIEVGRNDNLNGMSFYINSIIFNQKMKPTIILTFDGTYDESITYLYPYMVARNIPASLLLSNARTLTAAAFDYIIRLRVSHGWDIGMYGCNPNKEILTQDDNYRNQYLGLRDSKTWIQDNMIENPISYSAPYGNLRPITVPLLKDLGFKIARTEGSGYTSNFSDKDFAISVQLISNLTTTDDIKSKIDYAINNNLALCLYTRDVTEYGSEADSTQLMFESVIGYIMEKIDNGELQCLTMSEFYHRCTGK